MSDQHDSTGGTERQNDPENVKGNLTLRGTIEIPIQAQSNTSGSYTTQQHKHKSNLFEIITRVVELVVAAIVGGALVTVGYLQWTVYQQQAKIMEADHRPWVSIIQSPTNAGLNPTVSSLNFDDNGAKIGIKFLARNVSHTPALHVRAGIEPRIHQNAQFSDILLKQFCDRKRQKSNQLPDVEATVLFPDNAVPIEQEFTATIEAYKKDMDTTHLTISNVFAMICVVYETAEAPTVHATGVMYLMEVLTIAGTASGFDPRIKGIEARNVLLAPTSPGYAD